MSEYIRLTATHTNWVQAGALHTCVVHPGFTHWVVFSFEHTHRCNDTEWYEKNTSSFKQNIIKEAFCILTSGVKVALHGCSRAAAGLQKNPCSCKHKVHPAKLHLPLVWSGSCDPTLIAGLPYLYILQFCSFEIRGGVSSCHMTQRHGGRSSGTMPFVVATRRCWFIGGEVKRNLYFSTVMDTLEITSPCFSGHEPLVIQTITYAKQWLRGRRLRGRREDRGQQ